MTTTDYSVWAGVVMNAAAKIIEFGFCFIHMPFTRQYHGRVRIFASSN